MSLSNNVKNNKHIMQTQIVVLKLLIYSEVHENNYENNYTNVL